MMRSLKSLCLFGLCLALTVGSVTMAVARSQSAVLAGAGTFVICTGYGVTTITLDADGNPVGPVHPCPDCLAGLAACIVPDQTVLPMPATSARAKQPLRLAWLPPRPPMLTPLARGPPVFI